MIRCVLLGKKWKQDCFDCTNVQPVLVQFWSLVVKKLHDRAKQADKRRQEGVGVVRCPKASALYQEKRGEWSNGLGQIAWFRVERAATQDLRLRDETKWTEMCGPDCMGWPACRASLLGRRKLSPLET